MQVRNIEEWQYARLYSNGNDTFFTLNEMIMPKWQSRQNLVYMYKQDAKVGINSE
jgi:hypothetical protein